MRFVLRILLFPIVMILGLIKILLEGVAKVYCLVAGIAINILVICSVFAVITRQWFALVVFGTLFTAIIVSLMCTGGITIALDGLREKVLKI